MRWTRYGSHEFPDFDEDDIFNLIVENNMLKQENNELKEQKYLLIAEINELEIALRATNKLIQRRR